MVGVLLLAALGLSVIGLVLPWSRHLGITRNAFTYSAPLAALTLLTVAAGGILLAQCFAQDAEVWATAVRQVVATGGATSMLAGLIALGRIHKHDHQLWGPALFEAAMLAAIVLANRVARAESVESRLLLNTRVPSLDAARDRVHEALQNHLPEAGRRRWRIPLAVSGVSALAVSAAALTITWEQLTGAVVDELADHPLVWRGTELASTVTLRWVVAIGLALSLAAAALPRTRRLLPFILAGAGAAITWLTALRVADTPIRGTNATIGVGIGAWLTLAAGIVATASGVALFVVSRPETRSVPRSAGAPSIVTATSVVLMLALAGLDGAPSTSRAVAANGDDVRQVLPPSSAAADNQRLGEPADKASFARYSSVGAGSGLPILAGSLDEGPATWFVDKGPDVRYGRQYVIKETVRGRVLPVTVITGADDVQLLGVAKDHALVLASRPGGPDYVSMIDLHQGSSFADGRPAGSSRGEPTAVLTLAQTPSRTSVPGEVVGRRLEVDVLADGSVVVTVVDRNGEGKSYRVDASTVRGTAPWRLGSALPPGPVKAFYGPDGATYEARSGAISRIGSDGTPRPVLGNVSDARCTLSWDPLSSSLIVNVPDPFNSVLDRSGNLWTVLTGHTRGSKSVLYVLTKDGVLRRPAGAQWADVHGLQVASDGALYVTSQSSPGYALGSTYRIGHPDVLARAAQRLPPIPSGCVSDNRVSISTAGRRVTSIATVPADNDETSRPIVVDAKATTVQSRTVASTTRDSQGRYSYRYSIERTVAGQRADTAYTTTAARILDIKPDGRGGAWWTQIAENGDESIDTESFGHVDAGGAARIVAPDIATSTGARSFLLWEPDPQDGSLWWHFSDTASWNRTTPGGATGAVTYTGSPPIFGGGAGYTTSDDGLVVHRITATQPGPAILGSASGRQLHLPSGVAARMKPADFSVTGLQAVSSQGQFLLYQSQYLARVEKSGQVHILAGPGDGLPPSDSAAALVVGSQLLITLYSGKVYAVNVS